MNDELLDKFIGPSNLHSHKLTVETIAGSHEVTMKHEHKLEAPGHAHDIQCSIGWRMKKEAI